MFHYSKKYNPLILTSVTFTTFVILNKFTKNNSQTEQMKLLSYNDVHDINKIMKERNTRISDICQKYSGKKILHFPAGRYLNRMRYDTKHKLMYCENFKVSFF